MKLHVIVAVLYLVEVQEGYVTAALGCEGVFDGNEEFTALLPCTFGKVFTMAVVHAHSCPTADSVT